MGFCRSQFIAAQLKCKIVTADPLELEMTLRSTDYVLLAGFTGTTTTNCESGQVTSGGQTWQQLVIRTDANRLQIVPNPADTDCRVTADDAVVSGLFTQVYSP